MRRLIEKARFAFGKITIQIAGPVALALLATMAATADAQARFDSEAVRINNRGVAQMGQQLDRKSVV